MSTLQKEITLLRYTIVSYRCNICKLICLQQVFECVKWLKAQKQLRQQAKVPLVAALEPGIPLLTGPSVIGA